MRLAVDGDDVGEVEAFETRPALVVRLDVDAVDATVALEQAEDATALVGPHPPGLECRVPDDLVPAESADAHGLFVHHREAAGREVCQADEDGGVLEDLRPPLFALAQPGVLSPEVSEQFGHGRAEFLKFRRAACRQTQVSASLGKRAC